MNRIHQLASRIARNAGLIYDAHPEIAADILSAIGELRSLAESLDAALAPIERADDTPTSDDMMQQE